MCYLCSLSRSNVRWLAILWTGAIVAACSIPAASLSPIGPALSADKVIHFILFSVFGVLWMRALCPPAESSPPVLRRHAGRVLGWGGLFAVGTEVYQHLLPIQRTGDPYDALANGIGLLSAVLAYTFLIRSGIDPDHS